MLTRFWIVPVDRNGPMGIGVTGYDIEDALEIVRNRGYAIADRASIREVIENVQFEALPTHVQRHMGPMVVRGIWYPLAKVGL